MAIREILLLGNPVLLEKSAPIQVTEMDFARRVRDDLRDTMHAFRDRHGWGRAIAAPQIGVLKRIIYMEYDHPQLLINPKIVSESETSIELWDDCMSFPDLLVRVKRHRNIQVAYKDTNWDNQTIEARGSLSELLQHEIDHLDGILATMRAIDGSSFALQSQRKFLGSAGFAN